MDVFKKRIGTGSKRVAEVG